MNRKTFDVITMIDDVNARNRKSVVSADVRNGWNSLLETLLHDTGNYAGFNYLEASEVPEGALPGIVWAQNQNGARYAKSFPDESRRFYYVHRKLRK